MKKCLTLLVFVLLLSQSCTSGAGKEQVTQNDKIDPKVKATIEALNGEVYTIMCENNYEKLSQMFTDTLLSTLGPDFAGKFMPNMQRIMKDRKYRVFDEFCITHAKPADTIKLAGGLGDGAYTMKLIPPIAADAFVAMLVAGDSINEVMLTLVYINTKGKWKINNLYGENYSLGRRNAVEQYHEAQSLEKSGYLTDAEATMGLAKDCMIPGGRSFRYKKQTEINTFVDTLIKQTDNKYTLPYTFNEIKTKPKIVDVRYQVYEGTFVPLVAYQSTVNVGDTVALKQENDLMQKSAPSLLYGIDKANKTILYRVYNELPNGQNNPRYYGYIEKVI